MEDINKKEPTAEPAAPEESTAAEPTAEPVPVTLTEESVRKICEEVIGGFLDRFSPEVKEPETEDEVKEDEESFDY